MIGDEYTLGDDQPKKDPKDDRLGYAPFARRLANVVINMSVPDGYVIGLHGRWGSGKTTVVNFVLEYIREHEGDAKRVEHVDFRPWIVSGHQDLMAAFFKLLSEQLKPKEGKAKRLFNRGLRTSAQGADNLVDAAAALSVAIDPSGGVLSGLAGGLSKKAVKATWDKFHQTPSLQKAYEDLRDLLAKSNRRFLVTIDDIDRLDDDEIKSIMQMVKTIGRLPNVIYLLVYDREIVWQALDEGVARVGPRFAEKIVQQEVELPLPGKHALLGMLDDEIRFITAEPESSARWHYIVRNGVHRWINKPRDVLRFSNALKFAWPALQGEFDAQDLIAIEGIRLFDPIAFDWVRQNRDFFFSEGRYSMGGDEERKSSVRELKAMLPSANVGATMELLTVLFPSQSKWLTSDRYGLSENYAASQARRGLASEAGYDAYFSLHPSKDAVPKSTVDNVLDSLSEQKAIENALQTYLGKNNSRGRAMIGLFLQELRFRFAVQPKPEPSQDLLNALLSIGDEVFGLPWKGELFFLEPRGTLRFLISDLLEAWGEEEAGKHLVAAFKDSNSPFVLADVYVHRGRELGIFPSNDHARPVISKEDFEKLGAVLMSKIQAAADDGSLVKIPFFSDVARSWKHLGNPTAAKEWLRKGVEADATFAARVVRGLVNQSSSGNGIHYKYREKPDEDLYDQDTIHENAVRHLREAEGLTDDEEALLRAFVKGAELMRAGKPIEIFDDDGDE